MRILVALGGNAMTGPGESVRADHQIAAVEAAAEQIAALANDGHQVLISHGNGPQVGNILAKNDLAAYVLTPVPLDWCVANTQGSIGFILLNALDRALARRRVDMRPAVVVTRALVEADDPAFDNPTKPIGRYVDEATAERLSHFGQVLREIEPGRFRRVVPSPEPREILDAPAIDALLKAGLLVVAGGGGGIPVTRDAEGVLHGAEAVIDKDLASVLLARQLGADALVLATNVDNAWINWGKDDAAPLGEVGLDEIRRHEADGQFGAGSMGPKVAAIRRFVEDGGPMGIITALDKIGDALEGNAGTVLRG
ncbi:carbamate kinase [Tessaracoccus lubricantis]|uniref:carbamate kinase n=1 Tax=Tessaracoccus lubricantis TaxID=545543 RepID=UPI0031EBC391